VLVVTMTAYEEGLPVEVAFPPEAARSLAQAFAEAGWRQLHVAETEKYAHVTYFFNGGVEQALAGEERRLVPSNRDVATYDLAPEMSAAPVADSVVDALKPGGPTFILVNFANPDMVGHTGKMQPAVSALETIDTCVGRIVDAYDKAALKAKRERETKE
jgi:2,3-bisphosphoglycerate-independent phosphoglycerate mutase